MKTIITAILLITYSVTVKTSDENHDDIDEILSNDSLLKNYFDCLLDKGECPPEGQRLRKRIPEVLENGCPECTEDVKKNVWKVIVYLVNNKPQIWKALVEKYDPEGKYKEKYSKQLAEHGIKA